MRSMNRNGAIAAMIGALALLSGCGSGQSSSLGTNSTSFTPGVPGTGGGGSGGCYRADQPVPFTVSNAYLSGIQMCTAGSSISCPSSTGTAAVGGSGATQSYFTDVAVDGVQSVRMDIIPYSTAWRPNATVAPMTGNARGTFQIGPNMLNYLRTMNGGQVPCISRVVGLSTGFDPYPGSSAGRTTLFSTRIVVQWQGMASGVEELQF